MKKDIEIISVYEIKFHGPTNTRGARVSITDKRNNKRSYYSYDYQIGDILQQGIQDLINNGVSIIGYTGTDSNGYLVAGK